MVDITITPGSVLAGANASIDRTGNAGEAITAGQAVYKSTAGASAEKWMLADNNSATAEAKRARGIALNGAALNQPLAVQTAGDITIGATIVAGTDYYLGDTPGGICPQADVGAGETVCMIGIGKSTTVLAVAIQYPGVTI